MTKLNRQIISEILNTQLKQNKNNTNRFVANTTEILMNKIKAHEAGLKSRFWDLFSLTFSLVTLIVVILINYL